MRLAYAKWLLGFIEENGIGLERGEYAEWQQAEFRVHGVAGLPRAEVLPVSSDVDIGVSVQAWEAEVLGGMAHELLAVLVASNGDREPDEP